MKVEDVVDDWVASPPYLYFKLKEVIEESYGDFWCMRNEWAAHPLL